MDSTIQIQQWTINNNAHISHKLHVGGRGINLNKFKR